MPNKSGKGIITEARKYIGIPYEFGGNGLETFDCSGFTRHVIKQVLDIDLPRTSANQYAVGQSVELKDLQEGDLIFWGNTGDHNPGGITHVAFYIADGKFIGAQGSTGVAIADMTSNYWTSRYTGARRLVIENKLDNEEYIMKTHTIAQNDTLWSISRQYNIKVDDLYEANPLINPNQLEIGYIISLDKNNPKAFNPQEVTDLKLKEWARESGLFDGESKKSLQFIKAIKELKEILK